jgi:acetylornithine aminotransferase
MRGQGLMLGGAGQALRRCWPRAAEAGLLLSVTADSVIRLVPPLILSTPKPTRSSPSWCR